MSAYLIIWGQQEQSRIAVLTRSNPTTVFLNENNFIKYGTTISHDSLAIERIILLAEKIAAEIKLRFYLQLSRYASSVDAEIAFSDLQDVSDEYEDSLQVVGVLKFLYMASLEHEGLFFRYE